VLPYWYDHICADILANKKVIIVAHVNSLKAIIQCLDKLSDEEVSELHIPTGIPLIYELDEKLIPIHHSYIASEEELKNKEKRINQIQ
jgi:2,3-bisphosphoglycerate-dependent phosphoglycerate mutase